MVSILGREKRETDDLAQFIYELFIHNNVYLKNYNQGFPPEIYPSEVGMILIEDISVIPVRIIGSPDIADRHRREIVFNAILTN